MFDLDSCVCFITNRVSKAMSEEFNERLLEYGMTRVQWIAMYYLLKHGRLSQRELGEKMDIKESTVARLVDRIEKEGHIERIKDSSDRRVTYLELTEKGRERIENLLPVGEKMSQDFAKEITEEEFDIFNRVLDKFMKCCRSNS